jgi:hypothetical protein
MVAPSATATRNVLVLGCSYAGASSRSLLFGTSHAAAAEYCSLASLLDLGRRHTPPDLTVPGSSGGFIKDDPARLLPLHYTPQGNGIERWSHRALLPRATSSSSAAATQVRQSLSSLAALAPVVCFARAGAKAG